MAFYGPGNSLWMDSDGIVLSGFDSDGYSTSNSATWQSTMIRVLNPYPSETEYFGTAPAMGYGKIFASARGKPNFTQYRPFVFDYEGNLIDSIPKPTIGWQPSLPAFIDHWGALMAVGNGRLAILGNGYRQDLQGQIAGNTKQTTNIALYDMDLNYIKTLYPSFHNNANNNISGAGMDTTTGYFKHDLKIEYKGT